MTFEKEKFTGLVVGNASMSASVTPSGRLYGRIVYNPPHFNGGMNTLREAGEAGFSFTVDGVKIQDCELDWDVKEHIYPRYMADSAFAGVDISVYSAAPLSARDIEDMFAPYLLTSFCLRNTTDTDKTVEIYHEWHTTEDAMRSSFGGYGECHSVKGITTVNMRDAFISVEGADFAEGDNTREGVIHLTAKVTIPAGEKKRMSFFTGVYEETHRYRMKFDNPIDVCSAAANKLCSIKEGIADFILSLPSVGDEKIDLYTRWYASAAIILTKSAISGEVITMGYSELNQRDSFWTSFIHLAMWPELERDIMRTSKRWMRPDGKIPTTVLPRIERDFDIDINEYYCLRIARYFRYHRDYSFLEEMWDSYVKSVKFLLTFDRDGDGLPEQATPDNPMSFWGDWKDVLFVQGRKLAPHFTLLWLAVLKEGAYLAEIMDDGKSRELFLSVYEKAYENNNRDFADGGLWDGDHYAEVWYDERHLDCVLIDQTVGMIYGVVPPERAALIYKALEANENDYGIRETFPYRTYTCEYMNEGGDYHNGGIWPYLVFCDAMGRYMLGRADEAERIIKKVGYADLEMLGDFTPGEYLEGDSGVGRGKQLQGWAAALFGTLTLGAFGFEYISDKEIKIKVSFKERDFDTVLILPRNFGKVTVSRRNGKLSCEASPRRGYSVSVVEAE